MSKQIIKREGTSERTNKQTSKRPKKRIHKKESKMENLKTFEKTNTTHFVCVCDRRQTREREETVKEVEIQIITKPTRREREREKTRKKETSSSKLCWRRWWWWWSRVLRTFFLHTFSRVLYLSYFKTFIEFN